MKEYTVILTQKEIDAIWLVVASIIGSNNTDRRSTSDMYYSLIRNVTITVKRNYEYYATGTIRFLK